MKDNLRTTRVGVTGIGRVTPVGNDTQSSWQALCEGRSGAGSITYFDPSVLDVHIAAEVKDFDASRYLDRKEIRRNDRFVHFAMAAPRLALDDAAFAVTHQTPAPDLAILDPPTLGPP